jgi:hypothetical protein
MSGQTETGTGQQSPGRTSNGSTAGKTTRKSRAKTAAPAAAIDPPAPRKQKRRTKAQIAAAAKRKEAATRTGTNVRGLTAAASAARSTAKVSPFLMEALFQQLPAAGEAWSDEQNQVFLEAVAATTKLVYGLKNTITITAIAA